MTEQPSGNPHFVVIYGKFKEIICVQINSILLHCYGTVMLLHVFQSKQEANEKEIQDKSELQSG